MDRAINQPTLPEAAFRPWAWLAGLVLVVSLLLDVGVRIRLLDFPLERDEGEYAYAGQLLLQGVPPYQVACNMKMPGIYLAYAAIMAVFGQTPAGIHLGLLLVHLMAMGALFLVAREFLDLYGAVLTTAAGALMLLSPSCLGLAAHATHFVLLFALPGFWLLLRSGSLPGISRCFGAGFLLGIAFLMKQHGLFLCLGGGLYLTWIGVVEKPAWRQISERLAVYLLGCALPFLVTCLWLWGAGVFGEFWFWTFTYTSQYVTTIPFSSGMEALGNTFSGIFAATGSVYLAALLGFVILYVRPAGWRSRVFLTSLLFFAVLAICPGWYFRPHYFILLIPAVALLAGLCASRIARDVAREWRAPWLHHVLFLAAAIVFAQSLLVDRAVLFSLPPQDASRAIYGWNPFPEALDIAQHIARDTRPDQRIVALGDEPEIYFYARRHSAIRQMYPSQLMDPRPYARAMTETMISEAERNPPEYLVFFDIPCSWLKSDDSDETIFKWAAQYTNKNMRRVGLLQPSDDGKMKAVWGPEAESAPLVSPVYIAVYKRLEKP